MYQSGGRAMPRRVLSMVSALTVLMLVGAVCPARAQDQEATIRLLPGQPDRIPADGESFTKLEVVDPDDEFHPTFSKTTLSTSRGRIEPEVIYGNPNGVVITLYAGTTPGKVSVHMVRTYTDPENPRAGFWGPGPTLYVEFYPVEDELVGPPEEFEFEYVILPEVARLEGPGTIGFRLVERRNGTDTPVESERVAWSIPNGSHKPVSSYGGDHVAVGEIDQQTGLFTAKAMGRCRVDASMHGGLKASRWVDIECRTDLKGDVWKLIEEYGKSIPRGPVREIRDLEALLSDDVLWNLRAGQVTEGADRALQAGILRVFRQLIVRGDWGWLNNFIANWLFSGFSSASFGLLREAYEKVIPQLEACDSFKCDGYQERVLRFLHGIEQDLEKCHLLNGWEWGPIWGIGSGHRAVVVYPEGTDWKKEGTVLDPWPTQQPEWYRIADWERKFPGIAGETVEGYRDKYPTTMNWRQDLEKKAWHWKAWDWLEEESSKDVTESSLGWLRLPEYTAAQLKRWITGFVDCPVDLVITDQEGQRSGVLEDGSTVFEIPYCFLMNAPDEEGDDHWYFELDPEIAGPCRLEIRGKGEGTFQLLVASAPTGGMLYYGEQFASPGAVAELLLDVADPEAPLVLSDGREIRPIVVEPALGELTGSELTVRVEDASGEPGQTAEVTIYAARAADVGRLHVELAYDDAVLTPRQVSEGTLTVDSMLITDPDTPGHVSIGLVDRGGFSGDGSVAVVTFHVRGKAGDASELELQRAEAGLADGASTAIDVATESGTFRVVGAAVEHESIASRRVLYALCAAPLAAVLVLAVLVAWARRVPERRGKP